MVSLLENLKTAYGANGEKPKTPTPVQIQNFITEQQARTVPEETPKSAREKRKKR